MENCYSWLAIQGLETDAALNVLSMSETGEVASVPQPGYSIATLPDGSVLIVSTNFDFADHTPLAELSARGLVTTCCFTEKMMYSSVSQWRHGERLWYFFHDGGLGIQHMHTEGKPPPEFHAIANRLMVHQVEGEGIAITVDHVFEVAPEVAHTLTGFRLGDENAKLDYRALDEN